jgi:hypothetical protein
MALDADQRPSHLHSPELLALTGLAIPHQIGALAVRTVHDLNDYDATSLLSLSARPRLEYASAPVTPLDDLIPEFLTEQRDHAL